MKAVASTLAGLALVFFFAGANADEAKEVTLKGNITCNKCELKKAAKCETVIVVKEGGKDVVYHFDPVADKKHHSGICKEGKTGTVKGTVTKEGDKQIIKVSELKFE